MWVEVSNLHRHRGLLWRLLVQDLHARYVGSWMGLFWNILNPLVLLSVYVLLFSVILRIRFGAGDSQWLSATHIFCGMLPWIAFQDALQRSTSTIRQHAYLVKNMSFPSKLLPLVLTLSGVAQQLAGVAVLAAVLPCFGIPWTPWLLLLPFLLVLQVVLTLGCAWFLASLDVYLRDVTPMVGLGLTVWLFVTPIFYPEEIVPPSLRFLIWINPMAHLVRAYRAAFLEGAAPQAGSLLILAVWAFGMLAVGYRVFERLQPRFGDHI